MALRLATLLVLLALTWSIEARAQLPLSKTQPENLARHGSSQLNAQAYTSLIYDDSFLLGLRVLGQSLRETGTQRDMVALVAGNVSREGINTLASDGWRIHMVEAVQNPGRWSQNNLHGAKFPARFWAVYTKLLVFNLTEYERVIYLDADTVVSRNIDELFLCDGFCGVLRHSERLNTGVLVLEPSAATLSDMLQKVASTPSYTGGDQGFLNEYFPSFADSPLFDPREGKTLSETHPEWKDQRGTRLARLPTVYNADLGLYILNSNRWPVAENDIGVIHYTLATFKPWDWWSSWILGDNGRLWQAIRSRLPPGASAAALGADSQGSSPAQTSMFFRLVAPWVLGALMLRRWCWNQGLRACVRCCCAGCAGGGGSSGRWKGGNSSRSIVTSSRSPRGNNREGVLSEAAPAWPTCIVPAGLGPVSILVGLLCIFGAMYVAVVCIIPRQIEPLVGWALMYEWGTLVLVTLFSVYLRMCKTLGQSRAHLMAKTCHSTKEGPFWCGTRPWMESIIAFTILVASLLLLPWWTDLFGGRTFVGKVLGSSAAGMMSMIVCSQCFVALSSMWFVAGALDKESGHGMMLPLALVDKE